MRIFDEANEQGHTIVMVTHKNKTVRFAKRILRTKNGRLIGDGKVL